MDAEIDEKELAGCDGRRSSNLAELGPLAINSSCSRGDEPGQGQRRQRQRLDARRRGTTGGQEKTECVRRPSCKESVFGKMLANEAALLDPATKGARHFVCAAVYHIRSYKGLIECEEREMVR